MNKELKTRVELGISSAKHIYDQPKVGHLSINSIASPEIIYILEKIEALQKQVNEFYLTVNEHEESLFRLKSKGKGK